MVKDEVEHAARANMKIRVIEEFMLHVCFIEFTINLGSGTLYMAGHEIERRASEQKTIPRQQHPLSDSGLETECRPHLPISKNTA